ncbi:MAG: sigma-70 family RNA polymerase sigma factor [bacterium]
MSKESLFRKAMEENEERIFRICRYYYSDSEDQNDAFQESLVRIWEKIDSFRNESKLSTWIYRVVVNTCLSGLRREKKRKGLFETGRDVEKIHITETPPGEAGQEEELKLDFFRTFMKLITPVDRMLVSLYLEEVSTKEMSEITGLSESNVRVKIHRIKEQIIKAWEEQSHGIR